MHPESLCGSGPENNLEAQKALLETIQEHNALALQECGIVAIAMGMLMQGRRGDVLLDAQSPFVATRFPDGEVGVSVEIPLPVQGDGEAWQRLNVRVGRYASETNEPIPHAGFNAEQVQLVNGQINDLFERKLLGELPDLEADFTKINEGFCGLIILPEELDN